MLKWVCRLALLFLPAAALAQTGTIQGYCDQGGVSAAVSGLPSTNKLQGNIPSCTITVYLTGTTTLATIFRDGSSTPLSNPFTADALGSLLPGHFLFWTALAQAYDVTGKGGIAPNVYPQTVPLLTDVFASSAGGGGTSLCGPLAGDSDSTNCGNNNFVGTPVTQGVTVAQAYGFANINNSPFIDEAVAIGNNNLIKDVGTSSSNNMSVAVGIGLGNGNFLNSGGTIVGIGQANAGGLSPSGSTNVFEIVALGDTSAGLIGSTVDDVIAIGDAAANTIPTGSHDIIAIGDSADGQCPTFAACGGLPPPATVHDVIAIGTSTLNFNSANDVAAVGHEAMQGDSNFQNSGGFNFAFGTYALRANSTGQHNTAMGGFAGADGFVDSPRAYGNSNHTGSNNSWFGFDSGPGVTTQLSNTNAFGYQAHNTASNQTVIGNSSITSLLLFGCPTGQSVLDDGSGTCYVPGSSSFITSLTTTGTSGPATVAGGVLNIPQYSAGGSGPTLQTNGTNNTSQSTLNFVNPTAFNGLTFAFSNPTSGNETFAVGGTLGNAGLTNPSMTINSTTCTLGGSCTVSTSGSGSVGTAGQLQMVGSTAGSFAASHATDNGAIFAISEPTTVNDGTGKAGNIAFLAGTAPSAALANTVQINAPTSVTAYSIVLPGAQPTGASQFLTCTNANPSVCSFAAPSGSGNVTAGGTLAANQIVLGVGTTAVATLGALGTTSTVLHGNASGAPSFGAVVLSTDVSGNLPNANLATQSANTVLGALTATTPSGLALPSCSSSSSALIWTSGTGFGCNTTETQTIASGTSALGTSAIASGGCATVVTTTATGTASTDAISWNPNASIKAVTGYVPSTSGGLTIAGYPTTNAVNWDVCNWTSASITPGAVTLNWRVTR